MSGQDAMVSGVAAGVPYLAMPPAGPGDRREPAPLIVSWHLNDPPRSITGTRWSGAGAMFPSMTATNDASPGGPAEAQFGPHRFYAGEGGGSAQFRGGRFDVAGLRGARFTDCDLTGVTIRDGWLVNVSISGYLSNVTVNDVDVTGFVNAELDRRHPERVQFREGQTAGDVRALWDTIE